LTTVYTHCVPKKLQLWLAITSIHTNQFRQFWQTTAMELWL